MTATNSGGLESGSGPLVVDLDGSLLRSDFLLEGLFYHLRRNPFFPLAVAGWLFRGRLGVKHAPSRRSTVTVTGLPYDADVLGLLDRARCAGRRVVLATATHQIHARAIADHLGVFDDVLATTDRRNLAGAAKRECLEERFGPGGFDYVGNARDDLAVWPAAAGAILVNPTRRLERVARERFRVVEVIRNRPALPRVLVRQLRPHQWLKNALLAVPLLAAHGPFTAGNGALLLAAFIAFGLCASGVYCLNDLLDLEADRRHPRKRHRPLAAGDLALQHGVLLAAVLPVAALGLALVALPLGFAGLLLAYILLTAAYSLGLKRLALIDALVLALLYTLRIVAGAAAVSVPLSFWILAFSLFIFWSLALVKRYTELVDRRPQGDSDVPGRGYRDGDAELLPALGGASGFIAVLVLALYIDSGATRALYAQPQWLWVACPVLLYWVSRVWLLAHRGEMHDDPVVFAVRDPASWVAGLLLVAVFYFAS